MHGKGGDGVAAHVSSSSGNGLVRVAAVAEAMKCYIARNSPDSASSIRATGELRRLKVDCRGRRAVGCNKRSALHLLTFRAYQAAGAMPVGYCALRELQRSDGVECKTGAYRANVQHNVDIK